MHVMIDLETLGTDAVTAPIIQIAAVPFDLRGDGPADFDMFQARVSARSNEAAPFNRRVSADTVRWWADTNPTLLANIMDPAGTQTLTNALDNLTVYMKSRFDRIDGVWANGPLFDIAMLESAYQQAGLLCPWSFRAARCFRTIAEIIGDNHDVWEGGKRTPLEVQGEAHDARVDCLRQLRHVQQAFRHKVVP